MVLVRPTSNQTYYKLNLFFFESGNLVTIIVILGKYPVTLALL
jgi:hypothetical protein